MKIIIQMAEKKYNRPIGVSIIAILGILSALLWILGGLAVLAIGQLVALMSAVLGYTVGSAIFGTLGVVVGGLMLLFGLIMVYGFYKVWHMKKSGWVIVMILNVLSIIPALLTANMIGLILPIITVAYLWTVRKQFK